MELINFEGGVCLILIINKKLLNVFIAFVLIVVFIAAGILIYNWRSASRGVLAPTRELEPIRAGSNERFIAFAMNVDWGNEVIPGILQILKEKNVKITFFVTGRWAKEYPELFQRIVDEGHEIGSHGYHHLNYSDLNQAQNEEQIIMAEKAIMKHTSKKPVYFAPPSGAYNESTLKAADRLGYETILWSIDTIDWRKGSTEGVILQRVLDKASLGGGIVLMHPMPETAKALPKLIDRLREKGLEVGGVTDILRE